MEQVVDGTIPAVYYDDDDEEKPVEIVDGSPTTFLKNKTETANQKKKRLAKERKKAKAASDTDKVEKQSGNDKEKPKPKAKAKGKKAKGLLVVDQDEPEAGPSRSKATTQAVAPSPSTHPTHRLISPAQRARPPPPPPPQSSSLPDTLAKAAPSLPAMQTSTGAQQPSTQAAVLSQQTPTPARPRMPTPTQGQTTTATSDTTPAAATHVSGSPSANPHSVGGSPMQLASSSPHGMNWEKFGDMMTDGSPPHPTPTQPPTRKEEDGRHIQEDTLSKYGLGFSAPTSIDSDEERVPLGVSSTVPG
jgi:hypothetical protein